MEKIQLHTQAPAAPLPIVIAGALVQGKENYLTIGAYGIMSIQPPVVYISSMKAHYTNAGIKETGYFSINVPPGRTCQEDRLLRTCFGARHRQVRGFHTVLRQEEARPDDSRVPGQCTL